MSENWMDDIRRRMINYETSAPEGLWEDIEAELRSKANYSRHRSATLFPMWARRTVGVAALMAVAVLVGRRWIHEPMSGRETVADVAQESAADMASRNVGRKQGVAAYLASGVVAVQGKAYEQADGRLADSRAGETVANAETPSMNLGNSDSMDVVSPQKEQKSRWPQRRFGGQSGRGYTYTAQAAATGPSHERMGLSIFVSGGTASSIRYRTAYLSSVSGIGSDETGWEDDSMLGMAIYNQGLETSTTIKHHQPVRIGLTGSYALNNRLAVETGVTYTRLSSDIRYGSESHYIDGQQTLHYVGVPLSSRYSLLAYKGIGLYLSAGVLVEKRVSGKRERTYVLNNEARETERENIRSKPLQLSVNAAVGIQYHVGPSVAIYAEPGAGYYFNDGSDIPTIYDEKPLNLNLHVGLRFTMGE